MLKKLMLGTGRKVQGWGKGGLGVKTGSGSHNYKLLKRGGGVICKILYGNWLAVIQIFIFSA